MVPAEAHPPIARGKSRDRLLTLHALPGDHDDDDDDDDLDKLFKQRENMS